MRSFYGRSLKLLLLGILLSFLAWAISIFRTQSIPRNWLWRDGFGAMSTPRSPFTGAFATFPTISALPKRQRRMTVVGVWNDDAVPTYLRHFLYTMQLNADSLDLLVINRLRTPGSPCLDFEKAGLNITWGGNIKVHCLTDEEWKRRYVDFLCSSEYGWNCNAQEYDEVTQEYKKRADERNFTWRPLLGHVVRDLFTNPDQPFWAWIDFDAFVGNFARYPFNVLSQLSILTGSQGVHEMLYMAGQLTAFNLEDQALGSAWKKFPYMKTAAHFTQYVNGSMPESSEERFWSWGYLRAEDDLPGSNLSFGIYPAIHGDDYYENHWNQKKSSEIYIISGRDILLTSTAYSRKEVETLILRERSEPVDDLGSIGWTAGEDGSAYLLQQPELNSSEAKRLAIIDTMRHNKDSIVHGGIVEDLIISSNCSGRPQWKQCIAPHPLTHSSPPLMRASLVHFKDQKPGHVLRRLERDDRPRGYERKLLKHHLSTKKLPWFEFPPFDITEDLVLRYNSDLVEVFRIGSSRNETLFYRQDGKKSIG